MLPDAMFCRGTACSANSAGDGPDTEDDALAELGRAHKYPERWGMSWELRLE